MDRIVFFLMAIALVIGIPAFTIIKLARLRASRSDSLSPDVMARLEAMEREVAGLQPELGETQQRLDFAERLLSKARDERRIGS